MYRKLFPATATNPPNPTTNTHSHSSGARADVNVAEFTAARCSKLEATLTALNQASATPDVHAAALQLMSTIADMLGAQHWAIYNVIESLPEETTKSRPPDSDEQTFVNNRRNSRRMSVAGRRRSPVTTRRVTASVQCSNWQALGREVSPDSIFGYSYLSSCPLPQPISGAGGVTFMTSPGHVIPNIAVTSPVLNVYQASASEYYNNSCHERYPDGVQCVLSAALIGENGLVSAVLELVNKSDPTASPFFDVEDEFILRSTLATWSLVLREAKAERDRDMRDQLLRRILADLQSMTRVEGLKDLITMAERSLANLLRQGETVVVAHAMSIPRYRQKKIRNLLLVPIMSEKSQITGVIVAMNKLPDETFFVKQDVDNMTSFAPLVAVLIYRAKVSHDTSNVMKALENKFALATDTLVSQDSVVLRVNGDLWITDCINGSICHPSIGAKPDSPLVSLIPSLQEVFYDDLRECIENNVPKFNTDYLVTFAAASPDSPPTSLYIDYSIFPSHLLQTAQGVRSARVSSESLDNSRGQIMSRGGSGYLSPTHGRSAHASAVSSRIGSREMLSPQANPSITLSAAAAMTSGLLSTRTSSASKYGSKPGSPPTNQHEVIIVMHASLDLRRLAKLRSRHFGGPNAPQSNAATLSRDPSMLMGAREQATVMLINLHSFSDAALMLSAAEVAGFLSRYYAAVTEVVAAAGGLVLSTSSDRVTCVFGLPAANADDAARAIRSAVQLSARLKQEMPIWLARVSNEARISFAIAISSGTVSGGACLFHNAETFAVVGEPVVIVPRLESNARQYGAGILLDKTTHDCAKRAYEMREIDLVWMPEYKARGSGSPSSPLGSGASLQVNGCAGQSDQDPPGIMPVYDIVGEVNQLMENDLRTAYICYELGLGEYRQRNFDAAITYFRKCKSLMPDDGPSAVMIERCRMAAEDPEMIPTTWDGIWKWDDE
ncbi:hypothetical protein BCR44DRAFT_1482509 [Catenaria anguillulae PL171]|uniref:Guanylate cyclase domain-containing protein n=1 Tax=Catenaria anguillulae PL171 TaxID=765915 RepID=A0A1Y2I136_9FUNG|nr:hypothetical protein BCR44DRAFT_1482509 [Catenaria anguillulae PL171]